MGQIILANGSKENAAEDIHFLARQGQENAKLMVLSGPGTKETVAERASALFIDEDQVLALLDPPETLIAELEHSLRILSEKTKVIIYSTSPDFQLPPGLNAAIVSLQQEKEKRLKEKVLAVVKADGKKMTDKAFALLKERIKDETLLEEELEKLLNYVGDKNIIEGKDVAAVISDINEGDYIALAEALARRDKKQVLDVLEALLMQGTNVLALHAFLARHIRLLLQAKETNASLAGPADFKSFSKDFGGLKGSLAFTPQEKRHYLAYQKPYYAFNLCKSSDKFTNEVLVSFLRMLAAFDFKVKKGTRHDRTSFEVGILGT